MKKAGAFWKRLSQAILAFVGIGTLTACYGSPPVVGYVKGRVFCQDSLGTKLGIEGIQVGMDVDEGVEGDEYQTLTEADGSFQIASWTEAPELVSLHCVDLDGQDNGGSFQAKTVSATAEEIFSEDFDIALEKQE